ncbi:hypothetical protein FKP32DRAFT_1670542 [Trametes sanguinea]|nr:hypothetical protein FKP32DRAFT_1670542 [Trametes sanguinea]
MPASNQPSLDCATPVGTAFPTTTTTTTSHDPIPSSLALVNMPHKSRAGATQSTKKPASQDSSPSPAAPPRTKRVRKRPVVESESDSDDHDSSSGSSDAARTSGEDDTPPTATPAPSKKRRGKGKVRVVEPLSDDDHNDEPPAQKSRQKRIEWRMPIYAPVNAYLVSRFPEYLAQPDNTQLMREIQDHVVDNFRFPHHGAEQVRNSVRSWLRNRKNKLQPDGHSRAADDKPKKTHPLLASVKSRAPSASALWAKEHRELIEQQLGDGDIGARQKLVATLFAELPDEQQQHWKRQAKELKDARANDSDQCYLNQDGLEGVLAEALSSLVGYGPEQVGAAVFFVKFAYRDICGKIMTKEFTAGHLVDGTSFSLFEDGESQSESMRWTRYTQKALPPNPQRRDPRLEYDGAGRPLLPLWDDDWNRTQAAETIEAFFQATWAYVHGHEPPEPLDFEAMRTNPDRYLPQGWRAIPTGPPTELAMAKIVQLHSLISEAQATPDHFTFLPHQEGVPTPATPVTEKRVASYISPARRSRTATPQSTHGSQIFGDARPVSSVLPTINEEDGDGVEPFSSRTAHTPTRPRSSNAYDALPPIATLASYMSQSEGSMVGRSSTAEVDELHDLDVAQSSDQPASRQPTPDGHHSALETKTQDPGRDDDEHNTEENTETEEESGSGERKEGEGACDGELNAEDESDPEGPDEAKDEEEGKVTRESENEGAEDVEGEDAQSPQPKSTTQKRKAAPRGTRAPTAKKARTQPQRTQATSDTASARSTRARTMPVQRETRAQAKARGKGRRK